MNMCMCVGVWSTFLIIHNSKTKSYLSNFCVVFFFCRKIIKSNCKILQSKLFKDLKTLFVREINLSLSLLFSIVISRWQTLPQLRSDFNLCILDPNCDCNFHGKFSIQERILIVAGRDATLNKKYA